MEKGKKTAFPSIRSERKRRMEGIPETEENHPTGGKKGKPHKEHSLLLGRREGRKKSLNDISREEKGNSFLRPRGRNNQESQYLPFKKRQKKVVGGGRKRKKKFESSEKENRGLSPVPRKGETIAEEG